MKNGKIKFVCIGAVHTDYILQLQKKYFRNRTNPVTQKTILGGVAYNIASKIAFLIYDFYNIRDFLYLREILA